jgi:hypothetical protein
MAVVRCEKCGGPKGTKVSYARSHKLVSDVSPRIFCGTGNCTQLALTCWLTDEEGQRYVRGERLFIIPFRRRVVQVTRSFGDDRFFLAPPPSTHRFGIQPKPAVHKPATVQPRVM